MKRLRKTCLTVLVWLTAASTLVAGTPHFVCACGDEPSTKRASPSAEESQVCCCCKGCSTEGKVDSDSGSGHSSEARCCVQNKGQQSQGKLANGSPTDHSNSKATKELGSRLPPDFKADHGGCQKKLAQTKALSLTGYQKKATEELAFPVPLLLKIAVDDSCPPLGSGQSSWAGSRFPPPADLVTLLQRFTI
jgi:hypothetical protein